MNRARLEAFSDGVLAIIITIMVLELKVPAESDWDALRPLIPVFISYALSFIFIGIYWNNHHHLMHLVHKINGGVLWANLHLLFWLSLIPFVTGWMGEHHFEPVPVALYGIILLCAACAYYILVHALLPLHEKNSPLATAMGADFKGKISIVIYMAAIPLAFVGAGVALALYALVALIWLVPDRRVEKVLPG